MNIKVLGVAAIGVAAMGLLGAQKASALNITFDDLNTRNNFNNLGISSTYNGFVWNDSTGLGDSPGWAVGTSSNPALAPAPTGSPSGNSYAWNWDGVQSLFIDFSSPQNVLSAYLATLSSAYSSNASTVQLFGYNASNALIGSSAISVLTNSFQEAEANFVGVSRLEFRANSDRAWFSVDDIKISPTTAATAIPTPALLPGLIGMGIAALRKRKGDQSEVVAAQE